jgi:hypothetical protein
MKPSRSDLNKKRFSAFYDKMKKAIEECKNIKWSISL